MPILQIKSVGRLSQWAVGVTGKNLTAIPCLSKVNLLLVSRALSLVLLGILENWPTPTEVTATHGLCFA